MSVLKDELHPMKLILDVISVPTHVYKTIV